MLSYEINCNNILMEFSEQFKNENQIDVLTAIS